jgi:hypothetical protein
MPIVISLLSEPAAAEEEPDAFAEEVPLCEFPHAVDVSSIAAARHRHNIVFTLAKGPVFFILNSPCFIRSIVKTLFLCDKTAISDGQKRSFFNRAQRLLLAADEKKCKKVHNSFLNYAPLQVTKFEAVYLIFSHFFHITNHYRR